MRETEQLRAEFLAMVSHELRGLLPIRKGSAATALDSPTDLAPAAMLQLFPIISAQRATFILEPCEQLNDLATLLG